jgi:hypothetical protein
MKTVSRSIALLTFISLVSMPAVANAQWMSQIPRSTRGLYPFPFLDACDNMNLWQTGLAVTAYLGSFGHDLAAADDASLTTCFSNMRKAGLTLTIETASFQPPPTPGGCGMGVDCYNILAPLLTRLINLGAPTIRIRIQEPLTVARYAGRAPEDAVNETVIFLTRLRANYTVQVSSIEAYPFNTASLVNWWMSTLKDACVAGGVEPPDAFELDHDRGASGWSWNDVISMLNQAHAIGWDFGYIFGSPVAPAPNWYNSVLSVGPVGIGFDTYTFESWETSDPSDTVPETVNTGYTFMSTVRIFRESGYFPR